MSSINLRSPHQGAGIMLPLTESIHDTVSSVHLRHLMLHRIYLLPVLISLSLHVETGHWTCPLYPGNFTHALVDIFSGHYHIGFALKPNIIATLSHSQEACSHTRQEILWLKKKNDFLKWTFHPNFEGHSHKTHWEVTNVEGMSSKSPKSRRTP